MTKAAAQKAEVVDRFGAEQEGVLPRNEGGEEEGIGPGWLEAPPVFPEDPSRFLADLDRRKERSAEERLGFAPAENVGAAHGAQSGSKMSQHCRVEYDGEIHQTLPAMLDHIPVIRIRHD